MSKVQLASTRLQIRRRAEARSFTERVGDAVRSYWRGPQVIKEPGDYEKFFGAGYQSSAGIHVTEANAFTFSAVFDAVNQISSDEAKQPLNLLKRRDGGGSDLYTDSKLYKILKHEANPEMGAMVFRRTLMTHALTCKGGFAEIERDGAGRPAALWILTPDRVNLHRDWIMDPRTGRQRLGPVTYRIDGGQTVLAAKDVLHIYGIGYDGYCGYSIIDKARQTIGLALAAEKFGAQYFGKGTMFGGHLESEDDVDEDQAKDIAKNIEAFRAAQDSAFRILVTGRGHKFHQFTNDPSKSQMDESRLRQVEEVARFFRMPPYKLGVNTPGSVSYASVEAANIDYYTGCLLDWNTLIEQEFNRKLIPPLEQKSQYIKHNANVFLRGDTAARTTFYMQMLDRGVFNADMVLDLEDMNPQPNGQGELLLVQGAMIPKDLLVQKIEADIAKAAQPPPAPPQPAGPSPTAQPTDGVVEAANARAEAATLMAEEARRQASEERELRIAMEATEQATASELTHLRESERQALVNAALLTATAETLRAEAQAAQTAKDVSEAARQVEAEARSQAEATAAEKQAQMARAEEIATEALSRATEATDAARVAREDAREDQAALLALQAERNTDINAVLVAEATAKAANERAVDLDAERVRLVGEAEAAAIGAQDVARQLAEAETASASWHGAFEAEQARRTVAEQGIEDAREAAEAEHVRLEAEAALARGEVADRGRRQAETEAELVASRAAAVAEQEGRAEAERVAAEALADLAAVTIGKAAALEASRAAEAAAQESARQLAEAESMLSAIRASSVTEQEARTAAEQRAAEAHQRAVELEAERTSLQSEIAEASVASVALEQSVLVAEAKVADLRASSVVEQEARTAAEQQVVEAQAARTLAETERQTAQSAATALEARLLTEAAARTAAEADAQAIRESVSSWTGREIAARRKSVVDIMRRMIDRESERVLSRAQTTPERFQQFLASSYYEGHEEVCVDALINAVREHLIAIRSDDDPVAETKRLIRQHIEDSTRQLSALLEEQRSDGLAPTVAGVMHRWAIDRPVAIADHLMQVELDYARTQPAATKRAKEKKIKFDKTKDGDIIGASIVEEP